MSYWEYRDERIIEPNAIFVGKLMEMLSELGKQGWELCQILEEKSSFHHHRYATLILKRKNSGRK
jgi:hypothetical protein